MQVLILPQSGLRCSGSSAQQQIIDIVLLDSRFTGLRTMNVNSVYNARALKVEQTPILAQEATLKPLRTNASRQRTGETGRRPKRLKQL